MKPPSPLQRTTYDYLEVSPPDSPVSRYLRRGTVLLVGLNTLAFLVSYLDVILVGSLGHVASRQAQEYAAAVREAQASVYWPVEALSTAFFAVEYVLRLWCAPASPRYRGRVRFALGGLHLIDLAAVVPFFVALLTPGRAATLALLRLGWGVRHLKLLRYLRAHPVVPASCDALLHEAEQELGRVRQAVTTCREQDLARVADAIEAVSRQGSAVAIRQGEHQRRGYPTIAAQSPDGVDASAFLSLFDQLADDLTNPLQMATMATRLSEAYATSAGVFDAAPTRAAVDILLDETGRVGTKPVPLRRLGRQHFASLASRGPKATGAGKLLYVVDVQREVARLRADLDARRDPGSLLGGVDLGHTLNQLRDIDVPVRLAWDNLTFRLEDEHQSRLRRVRVDIGRCGSLARPLGALWRRVGDRSLAIGRVIGEAAARVWATPRQYYREGVGAVSRVVIPTLHRLGILKVPTRELLRALDEARPGSVLLRGIPAGYVERFALGGVEDDAVLVNPDAEFSQLNQAIDRWRGGQESSFVITGHLGSGKTTLLTLARERLLAHDSVTWGALTRKFVTTAAVVEHLESLLGVPGAGSLEALAGHLLSHDRRVVLVDDCQHLFLRQIGGLEAVRGFFWLVAKTNHHVLWGLCMDECGYNFLSHTLPLDELFHVHVALQARGAEDLRRLIMMRHKRTSVSLHYAEGGKRYAQAVGRRLKLLRAQRPGQATWQEALELTFFDQLATVSAGNLTVALFYWLRALDVQDDDRFTVKAFEALNLGLIWQLSATQAFLLVALLQHGSLTAADLAAIMNTDPVGVRLELEILGNHNIITLDRQDDAFAVNPVVLKTLCDMLRARQLLY